jgi:hypothetical protein
MKYNTGFQKKHYPTEIGKLYLGMPQAKFDKLKDTSNMAVYDEFDFRTEFAETFDSENVEKITYYFTKDENNYLYEFIIKFKPDFNLTNYCQQMYGNPNYEDEWRFDVNKDFELMIWTFDRTLVIAGNLPGTEWRQ